MANEEKNVTVNEATQEVKEQETTNQAPEATEEEKKESIFKRIGSGIKKHGKKVLIPVGIAAAFAAGIAADKYGLPAFKKQDDNQAEEQ